MTETPASKFVIFAVPRTGSNLLCTLLNSHPEILCHHELFNPEGIFTAVSHRDQDLGLGTVAERDRAPLEFLEKVWTTGSGNRCVGFKWTRRQNEDVLAAMANDPTVKKIVLHRRNRIKTYVSDMIAQKTQQWEVYAESDLEWPRPRVRINKEELLAHMRTNARFYEQLESILRETRQPFIETSYEQLFNSEEQHRLLKFLGVDDVDYELQAASVKQNSTNLRDLIANYDDFFAGVRGEDLEDELKDAGL